MNNTEINQRVVNYIFINETKGQKGESIPAGKWLPIFIYVSVMSLGHYLFYSSDSTLVKRMEFILNII